MKVAHWKLNEQSGTVINDSSENTNTGTWVGTELVTNGDFSAWTTDNPDDWTVVNEDGNNFVTETLENCRFVSDGSSALHMRQTSIFEVGKTYNIILDVVSGGAGNGVKLQSAGDNDIGTVTNAQSHWEFVWVATGTVLTIFRVGGVTDITLDNISVREVVDSVKSTPGRGLLFDGVDDEITIPADSSIDINGKTEYSCSAWINPASDGEGNFARIIGKTNQIASPTIGYNFFVRNELSDNVKIESQIMHVTTNARALSTSAIIPLNKFSHVALVYNEDGAKKIKLYLDSVLISLSTDQAGVGNIVDDSAINLTIGNATENTTRTFDGKISDVRIFDEALSVAKIRSIYENGITPYFRSRYAGTVAHRSLRRRFSPNSSL